MLKESFTYPYYSAIKDRCLKLIHYNIWDGMDKNRLEAWLKNFDTDKDRFFAACILDHFIYRSEEQTISMLYDLLTRDLCNLFRTRGIELVKNPLELLRGKYKKDDPKFRIVSATKPEDPPSRSGFYICNLIVHDSYLSVNEKWVIKPENINREIKTGIKRFILIDDIICTGSQMKETIEKWRLDIIEDITLDIAVCAAHETGVYELNNHYPHIKIAFAEKLKLEDSIFEQLNLGDFDCRTRNDLRKYYKDLMKKKGIRYRNLLGFSSSELLYAFKHNVPNNCLPIIHYENKTFNSLLTKKK